MFVHMELHEIATLARNAFYTISVASTETRNKALLNIAAVLETKREIIFKANEMDLEQARRENLATPLLHRLQFSPEKMNQVINSLRSLAEVADPIGETTLARELSEELVLYRVSCPIGVIGVIFESRPDALVQIASLCLKSGNAVLLKGGREALNTNRCLYELIKTGAAEAGIPGNFIQLLETREEVSSMLKEDALIDLIIPRGSKSFVRYILDNSRIPVLGHADGLCHVYVDKDADLAMALRVALDSKVQNVSVCNAEETLLVHRSIADRFLPSFADLAKEKNLTLFGDETVCSLIDCSAATDDDWVTEYLDLKLSIKIVDSVDEAIQHINHFGSHHTDCIITENRSSAASFLNAVDSAGVYWNVSTRFADGFVYGFGAEVGIATGKIHARGPMGMNGLTTYKYKLLGNGQTMTDVKNGLITYTHRDLNKNCPV